VPHPDTDPQLYHHVIHGKPVAAVQWDGTEADTGDADRFLARHIGDADHYRTSTITDQSRHGHQPLTTHRLVIHLPGRDVTVPDGCWIVVDQVDRPRAGRTVLMLNELLFDAAYRKGLAE
jgi:hypothetical protein